MNDHPHISRARDRPFDKYERSPNNRATCKACKQKILKNQTRVGFQVWLRKYQKWEPSYYHKRCVAHQMLEKLHVESHHAKNRLLPASSMTSSNLVQSKLHPCSKHDKPVRRTITSHQKPNAETKSEHENEDEEVLQIGHTLPLTEVIRQKIAIAQRNGLVIEIS